MKKAIVPLCLLITIALALYLYINRFINYSVVEVDGYVFSTNAISDNLSKAKNNKKIDYEKVAVSDIIYKSNRNYYVGEKKKKSVTLDYPIISEDSSTLYVASNVGNFVSEDFEHEVSYAGTIITDGKVYNTTDYEQATDYSYYFVEMNNGVYINLSEINIKTYAEDIHIPVNSFISFKENSLSYYYLLNEEFIFVSHPVIDLLDKTQIGEFNSTYKQLLINLGLLKESIKEEVEDENKTKNNNNEGNQTGNETTADIAESKPEYIKKEGKREPKEKVWIAPEVSINSTYAKTYTYRGILNISDPAQTITKSPTFEFTINGNVSLRKTVGSKGEYKIIGLLPSTHYEVTAYYEYYDEKGVKRQKKIKFNNKDYFDSFTTEGIDKLNKLNFDLGKISTDTNSFYIANIKVTNEDDDEVLNGVKGVTIKTNDANFALTTTEIKYLINKTDFSYQSAKILKSNKDYNGEFVVSDTAGNILGVTNNKFTFKTKQKPPSAKIVVNTSKNFTKANMIITLSNPDRVNASNYKYIVYSENGSEFASGTVYENIDTYQLNGLDTAKKYTVKIKCDYVTNEKLTYRDEEIGSLDFISYDIEKLGIVPFTARINTRRDDSITSYAASINVAFANYDASDPLFDIIDEDIVVNLVNTETQEIEQSITANKYDFIAGKVFEFGYGQDVKKLVSNTKYEITTSVSVTSGNKQIPIKSNVNSKGFFFNTLKADAYVALSNIFIANGYIDFDAIIVDKDKAILNKEEKETTDVLLEIYNASKEKIYTDILTASNTNVNEEMFTNRVTIDSLNPNETYDFKFVASNYNDNINAESNKVLDGSNQFHLSGINSKIDIEQMIKTPNYYNEEETNLFELADVSRWKSTLYSSYNYTEKLFVSSDNNSITLGAYNGYRVYSYYLPENIGQDIVLSFKAKRGTDRNQKICLMNAVSNNVNNCFLVFDIDNNDYTEFENITFKLNNTGYISFYLAEEDNKFYTNSIEIKDLQIEVGTQHSAYKEFDSSRGYVGTFNTKAILESNVTEDNEGIELNQGEYDYRITLIKGTERERYDLFESEDPEDSIDDADGMRKITTFDNIVKDNNYTVTFSIYDSNLERYYDLSKVNFETGTEIRVLRTINDFFNMHSNGYYIALNDLDFMNNGSVYSAIFNGTLDMQGHKIIYNSAKRSYLFHTIGGGGVIKNADVRYYLNNTSAKGYHYGLTYLNYGTIEDIMFTVEESVQVGNYYFGLFGWQNYGTLQNFIVHCKAEVYGRKWMTIGFNANYGSIRNGYLYADEGVYGLDVSLNITEVDNTQKYSGVLVRDSSSGGIIENIYSTIKVNIGTEPQTKDKYVGSIASGISGSTVRNIYVYDDTMPAENHRDTARDIMFGSASNINYSNLHYFSEVEYKNTYSKPQQLTALKNVTFQDNTINRDGKFLTDKSWRLGIFPLLDLPDVMPEQDHIPLPSISGDELRFLSVDDVEYLDGDYTAQVALSFYNPNGLAIKGVSLEDIGTVDLIGKPSTNSDLITTVNVKLKNPALYKSYYTLASVNTNSSIIELGDLIPITLYMKISSLTSISNLNTNYILTRDIDCSTENCKNLGTFTGKLNGAEHTISNLTAPSCFINNLQGTLENVNFVNFKNTATNSGRVGLVCTLQSNGDITNVYSYNTHLTGYANNGVAYVGGLAGYVSSGMISDSAVNKFSVESSTLSNAMPVIGAIVGYGTNVIIDDSLARNIDIHTYSLPSDSTGIGGIIGVFASGKVSNVYATGKIIDNVQYLGGIVGRASGTTAMITNAIGNVHIEADQDYVGGINGYSAGTNTVSKTLALSNLSTVKKDFLYFDRTSGTSINRSRNYAWDKQSLNNVKTKDTHGEILLTQEELWNPVVYTNKLGFGVRWALDEKRFRTGYIPSLIKENGDFVKGQGYYDYEETSEEAISDMRIFYEDIFKLDKERSLIVDNKTVYYDGHDGTGEFDKYYAKQYTVDIYLENPHQYVIRSLVINGLKIDATPIRPSNDEDTLTTHIQYKVSPIRYYDSYVVTQIIYEDIEDGNIVEKKENVNMLLDLPFFGQINEASDWANIEKGLYENYIVDHEVDLGSLSTDELAGKSFNKLYGIGNEKPVIKNATVSFNKAGLTFLDTIVTDIKGIEFNNITINNTASGNYTGFIKYQNGKMSEMTFKNITINAQKISYNGIISTNQSPEIRNILIDGMNIYGASYVGFVAKSISVPITGLSIKNVNINATGSYVGAAIGYENWRQIGVFTSYIMGDNININTERTSFGNYIGGLFGYANGYKVGINNSHIKGKERVGGISGQHSNRTVQYNYTFGTTVEGQLYVGGSVGVTEDLYDAFVYNSTILGGDQVGGISGAGRHIDRSGSVKNVLDGNNYVGGIRGYMGGYTLSYNYVRDSEVNGNNYVGGIIGGMGPSSDNNVRYSVARATVTARNSSAGGILGYNNNSNTVYYTKTGAKAYHYRSRIYDSIVAGSTINAKNFGGGIVGQTTVSLYSDQYLRLLVAAGVNCEGEKCGYFNGTDDTFASAVSRLYVYENSSTKKENYSKVLFKNNPLSTNGTMLPTSKTSGMATYNDLKTTTLYGSKKINISGMSYNATTVLTKFPRPNQDTIREKTISQIIDELPWQPEITYKDAEDRTMTQREMSFIPLVPENTALGSYLGSSSNVSEYHEIPDANIYVSGVDTVNIDFSNVDDQTVLLFNGKEYPIEQRTYTFKYNFNSDFNFIVTDGLHTREYTYTKEDIMNSISVIGNNYYHIRDGIIKTNNSKVNISNAVNIFNDKVLLLDGNIYDIDKNMVIDNSIENYQNIDAIPLYKFNYLDEEIETYYSYSKIGEEITNDQFFVKNDNLEIIDSSINNKKDKLIIDSYNDGNFLLYLDNDGSINSLKENINFPGEFINIDIKDINSNINSNTDILFVLYNTGNYIVFNYKTGTLIENNLDNKPSLLEYMLTSYNETIKSPKLDEPVNYKYREAMNLIDKLGNTPLDKLLDKYDISTDKVDKKPNADKSNYVVKYNNETKEYDILEIKTNKNSFENENIVSQMNNNNTSVQEVIKGSKELSTYYKLSDKKLFKVDSIYENIVMVIIASIITVLLGILGVLVIKKIKFRSGAV